MNGFADDEKRLVSTFLKSENKEANKFVRPVAQFSDTIVVTFWASVRDFISFDTTTGELKLHLWQSLVCQFK